MTRVIKKLLAPRVLLSLGIIYTLLIAVASVSPTSDLPRIDFPFLDKIIHVLIYTIMALLWLMYGVTKRNGAMSLKTILLILFFCFLYGIIIEVIQGQFTAFRKADPWDVLANLAGVILGWLIFANVGKLAKR